MSRWILSLEIRNRGMMRNSMALLVELSSSLHDEDWEFVLFSKILLELAYIVFRRLVSS